MVVEEFFINLVSIGVESIASVVRVATTVVVSAAPIISSAIIVATTVIVSCISPMIVVSSVVVSSVVVSPLVSPIVVAPVVVAPVVVSPIVISPIVVAPVIVSSIIISSVIIPTTVIISSSVVVRTSRLVVAALLVRRGIRSTSLRYAASNLTSAQLCFIQRTDRRFGARLRDESHESESARSKRPALLRNVHVSDLSILLKRVSKIILAKLVRQVIDLHAHEMIHLRSSLSRTSLVPSPVAAAVSPVAAAVSSLSRGVGVHLPRLVHLAALERLIVVARRTAHLVPRARVRPSRARDCRARRPARAPPRARRPPRPARAMRVPSHFLLKTPSTRRKKPYPRGKNPNHRPSKSSDRVLLGRGRGRFKTRPAARARGGARGVSVVVPRERSTRDRRHRRRRRARGKTTSTSRVMARSTMMRAGGRSV